MITVRLKIGSDGAILDSRDLLASGDGKRGFVYLDSDKRVGSPSKGFEAITYPEEEGEHLLPKTTDAPFDYKVKFFIQGSSLADANAKIDAFNSSLYSYVLDEDDNPTDVKEYKQVTFFNDYKRHKIVGYPNEIAEATEFWRDKTNSVNDVVIVEWTIRVNKPSLCEYKTPFSDDTTD